MTGEDHVSWQDLLDLVTQLEQGSYETASIDFGDVSVRLSKNGALPAEQPVTAPSVAPHEAAPVAPAAAAAPVTAPAPAPATAPVPVPAPQVPVVGEPITAPMIGVFYRSPSPGAPPFVQEGEEVQADTTIGIIEVMKLMSPVTAGVAGRLVSFSVTDGEQVEFGQELAVVDTGGQ
ncbi:acetyl-CoA carboxylase [Kocuria sp. CPCC 205263]|uniref:acetyl-CoA carboxylase n=1 Tax=Kocuria sp. CPCC 205263 TaxID=3073555 RepID=UPI0034D3F9FD